MTESFAELFEQTLDESKLRPGAIVTGRVVEIREDVVVVNAGLKSEGIVPIHQFQSDDGELEVEVGDEVEVSLEAVEDGFGETRLSREKAKRARIWDKLETASEAEENVIGQISGKVKGGFTVSIDGIRAFLPGSLVDVRPVRDPSYLEGKDLEFKIIKLDRRRNNLVVSRRAVVEHEFAAEREDLIDRLEEGAVVKGVVKNLTDYGAFLDLGGIDGLLHITDMAWKRVRHPSEVVEVGDELEVRVLRFDRERMRVSLGLKQLGEDPWDNIDRRYPPGSRLFGRVTNITDYGCFVEIEDGVEGLVHVSEMDWTNKNVNPNKVVHIGEEVEVMVLDVDGERRRISMGMKQVRPNPWEAFAALHNKGDKVSGTIKSITDFDHFRRMPNALPGHIGNVQQAVDAAKIQERTIVGEVLDHTLDDCAFLETIDQVFALSCEFVFNDRTARNHQVVAATIELDDLELEILAFEIARIAHRTHVDQRARQECPDAVDADGETTLDLAGNLADHIFLGLAGLFQLVPDTGALGLFAREAGFSEAVLDRFERHFHLVADFDFELAVVGLELVDGHDALRLQSGIDDNDVIANLDHSAGDDRTWAEFGFIQCLFEQFGKGFGH